MSADGPLDADELAMVRRSSKEVTFEPWTNRMVKRLVATIDVITVERDTLQRQVGAIRAMHKPRVCGKNHDCGASDICDGCGDYCPCVTLKLLDRAERGDR